MKIDTRTIYSVQILRGIAALGVVLYHFANHQGNAAFPDNMALQNIAEAGSMGVNLFFLISGFIMFTVTKDTTDTWKFLGRRLIRIIPLYYLLLFTFHGFKSFKGCDTVLSMLFIPLEADGAPFYGYATFIPGWTLNYEVFFYIVFFVSLFFTRYRYYFIAAVFILLHAIYWYMVDLPFSQTFNPHVSPENINSGYVAMMLNPLTLLFPLGIVVGWLYKKFKTLPTSWHLLTLVFALTATIIYYNSFDVLSNRHGEITSGFCLLLLLTGLSMERFIVTLPLLFNILRPLVYLGTISYSVYLLHLLPIKFFPAGDSPYLNMFIVIACTVAISSVTYYLIENKFTKYLQRKLKV